MNRFAVSVVVITCVSLTGCATLKTPSIPGFSKRNSQAMERELSMARLMERHGKGEEAHKLYMDVLEKDPKNKVACHRLGILAVRRGEHDDALAHFERAMNKKDRDAELFSDIGYTYYLKNDLDLAEANLRESLNINPQYKKARTNLGLVLAEQGRTDDAMIEFRKAGSEADALSNLAFVQSKLGQLDEAEKNYHRALELDPKQRAAAEALVQFDSARAKAEAIVAKHQEDSEGPNASVATTAAIEKPSSAGRSSGTVTRPQPEQPARRMPSFTETTTGGDIKLVANHEVVDEVVERSRITTASSSSNTSGYPALRKVEAKATSGITPAAFGWSEPDGTSANSSIVPASSSSGKTSLKQPRTSAAASTTK